MSANSTFNLSIDTDPIAQPKSIQRQRARSLGRVVPPWPTHPGQLVDLTSVAGPEWLCCRRARGMGLTHHTFRQRGRVPYPASAAGRRLRVKDLFAMSAAAGHDLQI